MMTHTTIPTTTPAMTPPLLEEEPPAGATLDDDVTEGVVPDVLGITVVVVDISSAGVIVAEITVAVHV